MKELGFDDGDQFVQMLLHNYDAAEVYDYDDLDAETRAAIEEAEHRLMLDRAFLGKRLRTASCEIQGSVIEYCRNSIDWSSRRTQDENSIRSAHLLLPDRLRAQEAEAVRVIDVLTIRHGGTSATEAHFVLDPAASISGFFFAKMCLKPRRCILALIWADGQRRVLKHPDFIQQNHEPNDFKSQHFRFIDHERFVGRRPGAGAFGHVYSSPYRPQRGGCSADARAARFRHAG